MVRTRAFPIFAAILATCADAPAQPTDQFTPGHVFISEVRNCPGFESRIRAVDPETGASWILADGDDGLCANNGMAFTPDGTRLRTLVYGTNVVIDFDAQGIGAAVLTAADGLGGPWGQNGLAWGPAGDFYVANLGSHQILRYPVGGGAPLVVSTSSGGGLVLLSNGDLLVATGTVRRITPSGDVSVFDTYPATELAVGLAQNAVGDLFVVTGYGRIYRYDQARAENRVWWASFPEGGAYNAIAVAPNGIDFYGVDSIYLYQIDGTTGVMTLILQVPFTWSTGTGIAVYDPPPPGDLNCDRWVDFFDIDPFLLALLDPPAYAAQFSFCRHDLADLNADGSIDFFDVEGFLAALFPQ